MCGLWRSDSFDDTADYLILDDFDFDFFHGMRKAIWGAQEEFTHVDKWRKGVAKWGKPCIWICNPDKNPFTAIDAKGNFVMANGEREWYRENCVEVHIDQKMYIE